MQPGATLARPTGVGRADASFPTRETTRDRTNRGSAMVVSVLRTEDLPREERFESWYELVVRSVLPVTVRSEKRYDFRASLQVRDFGSIQVSKVVSPALETARGEKMIRRSDPEWYQIYLQLDGTTVLSQGGREAALDPGDLVLFSSSSPYRATTSPGYTFGTCTILQLPYERLPFPRRVIDRVSSRRLTASSGIAAVTRRYLAELSDQAPHCTPRSMTDMAGVTLDLISAWLAYELEEEARVPPVVHHRVMEARVHDYIRRHLGDPGLTPAVIASAHGMSVRSLYQLFERQGLTVAAWVRERRLENCRRDLADPDLCSRSIQAIAARWGFTDPGHFSRLFRRTSGVTPTDYRAQHLMHKSPRTVQI
ncbi:helix-turn-helix domain-containing protein [Streptomyces sp. NPDC058953]|uniref:AraC-like ligand-binding domain-containing protein n=1 Tax=unclassified Streptomyces TaxID=2593676 RepID=UPI0036B5ABF1